MSSMKLTILISQLDWTLLILVLQELHNSVSNYGRYNSSHPIHSYDLGVPLINYRRYVDDDTLGYTLMPIDMNSILPPKSNRWKAASDGAYSSLLMAPVSQILGCNHSQWSQEHKTPVSL